MIYGARYAGIPNYWGAREMLGAIFKQFVEESPISVMVRGLMERAFAPEKINQIFETNAQTQYTRELLFSSVVDLMSLVVCGIYPSVNAAYRAKAQQLNVSRTAVYDKLNGVETSVSAAIVRETGSSMASLIELIEGKSPKILAPYRVRVIDGNCLEGRRNRPSSPSTTNDWSGGITRKISCHT